MTIPVQNKEGGYFQQKGMRRIKSQDTNMVFSVSSPMSDRSGSFVGLNAIESAKSSPRSLATSKMMNKISVRSTNSLPYVKKEYDSLSQTSNVSKGSTSNK
eukprot:Awhi_evm3s3046